jgi:putative ABC transport system permease protein
LPTVLLVFSNEEQIKRVLEETIPEITEDSQIIEKEYRWSFNFVEDDRKQLLNFVEDFTKIVNESSLNSQRSYSYSLKTKDVAIESAHVFDGSFFFIGLLLSIVFMLATTLIIYFKQISEGLEDRRRFIIMQKVGMSQQEVKKTIHQQVIMVFSLPLIVALSHVVFAFPMMKQLLLLFEITQSDIFVKATISVVLCFILLYLVVYSLTAKIYYHLVEREI